MDEREGRSTQGSSAQSMSVADTLSLVDTLERLGIDNHFHKEIDAALSRINTEKDFDSYNDLHTVVLRFCLLRQHGFWVSAGMTGLGVSTCLHGYRKLYIL